MRIGSQAKKRVSVLLGAVALAAQCASGSLTIDVRAKSTSAGQIIDTKNVLFTGSVGDTVTMEIRALVSGNNGTPDDEGYLSFQGSFLSSNGGMLGNLAAQRGALATQTGSSNGLMTDLDGDGDLDVGSNNNGASANFFRAIGYSGPDPIFGTDILIGTVTLTRTTGAGVETFVNFRPRISNVAASWFEDGTQITSSNFSAGAPVRIFVPEPVGLTLGGFAFGLLARIRQRAGKENQGC